MKANRILFLCALVVLPQFALADQAADPEPLTIVRGILNYCSQVDPKNAKTFDALWRSILSRLPEELSQGRDDDRRPVGLRGPTDPGAAHVCAVLASSAGR